MTTLNETHVVTGQGRLLEQFKNATKLNAWLASYLGETQANE